MTWFNLVDLTETVKLKLSTSNAKNKLFDYSALTSGVFVCLQLLLPVKLHPINGFETAINQLPATPLRRLVLLLAVEPGIGSELTPSALFQNL